MERLLLKWETAKTLVPKPEVDSSGNRVGVMFYGTTATPMQEAMDLLAKEGIALDTCRIRAFPFGEEVVDFVEAHELVFLVEQNRDAQMRTLLINECEFPPERIASILYYAGLSISADTIQQQILEYYVENKLPRLTEVKS